MTIRRSLTQQRAQSIGGSNWFGQMGDPSIIPPNSAMGRSSAGVVVNERSVISLMTVFACLRVLGDAAASLQVHVYKKSPVGQARQEVEPPQVLTDPYADMTRRDGTFRQVSSLGLGGNIYQHVIDRDDQGNPTQIELLNPSLLKVEMVKGVKTYKIGTGSVPLNPDDIIHVPWVTLPGGLVGLNPIEIGSQSLGIAVAAEEYAARYFAQGIHPGGILSVEKPLTPEDAYRLQQELATNHGGISNSHTPIVIDADAHWEQLAISPETSQLLETRQFSREEISGFYGVPLYFLGDANDKGGSWVKGLQEGIMAFTMFSLSGYAARLDEADTALLPPGYYAKRNVSDLFKTNDQMLSILLMSLRNASIASPNELRPYVDLPPSTEPGADSLFAPLNSAQSDWFAQGAAAAAGSDASGDNEDADPSGSDDV